MKKYILIYTYYKKFMHNLTHNFYILVIYNIFFLVYSHNNNIPTRVLFQKNNK